MSITLIIIIVTSLVSFTAFSNQQLMKEYQFNAYFMIKYKQWYRFITHGFLHADFMHLFFNMFVLYFFGEKVEAYFHYYFGNLGMIYYPLLYLTAIFTSIIPSFERHKTDSWYNSVGASGGVSAIMFAYILFSPTEGLCLYGIPFLCWPAIVWAIIYLAYSAYMGRKGQDNVNHDAHMWGALFGFGFTILLKPALFLYFIDQIRYALGI